MKIMHVASIRGGKSNISQLDTKIYKIEKALKKEIKCMEKSLQGAKKRNACCANSATDTSAEIQKSLLISI